MNKLELLFCIGVYKKITFNPFGNIEFLIFDRKEINDERRQKINIKKSSHQQIPSYHSFIFCLDDFL